MNIYATKGDKVVVTRESAMHGTDSDRETINDFLTIGTEYVVEKTFVGGSYTDVLLQGFPNMVFNSVMFEDVKEKEVDEMDMVDTSIYYANAEVVEMLEEYKHLRFVNSGDELIVAYRENDFIYVKDLRDDGMTAFHLDDSWYRIRERVSFGDVLNYPIGKLSVKHELVQGGSLEYGLDFKAFLTKLLVDYSTVEVAEILRDGWFYMEKEGGQ